MIAIVTHFYADLPVGTQGDVVKSWNDGKYDWHKLLLGTNQSGKKLFKSVPADCLKIIKPFESTHKLNFEVAPDSISEMLGTGMKRFRVGTCEGLWQASTSSYFILAVSNSEPGNGHLDDVFEWFENSCKRDNKSLVILEVVNGRFKAHLINKRGFWMIDDENLIKTF